MARRSDDNTQKGYRIIFPNRLNYGQLIVIRRHAAKHAFPLGIVTKTDERDGYYFTGTEEQILQVIEKLNKVTERFRYGINLFRKYEIVSTIPDDSSITEIVEEAVAQSSGDYVRRISERDKQIHNLQNQVGHLVGERARKEDENALLTTRVSLLEDRIALDNVRYQAESAALKAASTPTEQKIADETLDLRGYILAEIKKSFARAAETYSQAFSGTTLAELKAAMQAPEDFALQQTGVYAQTKGILESKLLEVLTQKIEEPPTFAFLTKQQYTQIAQEMESLERTISTAPESVRAILENNLKAEIDSRRVKIADYLAAEESYQQEAALFRDIKTFYESKCKEQQVRKDSLKDNIAAYLKLETESLPLLVEYDSKEATVLFPIIDEETKLVDDLSTLFRENIPTESWNLCSRNFPDYKMNAYGMATAEIQGKKNALKQLSSAIPILQKISRLVQERIGISIKPYFLAAED